MSFCVFKTSLSKLFFFYPPVKPSGSDLSSLFQVLESQWVKDLRLRKKKAEEDQVCRSRQAAEGGEGSDKKIAFVQPWIITNKPLKDVPDCNYIVSLLHYTALYYLPSLGSPASADRDLTPTGRTCSWNLRLKLGTELKHLKKNLFTNEQNRS